MDGMVADRKSAEYMALVSTLERNLLHTCIFEFGKSLL